MVEDSVCHGNTTRTAVNHLNWVALFPGPTQLSVAISMEKRERAWYLFSREWRRDRKDGRKGLIVRGCTGPRTAKTANVAGITYCKYLASGGRLSYTQSVERVVSWTIRETQPVCSENFCHFPITSYSHEKTLPAFPYCKWRKTGRGLGTRLNVHKQVNKQDPSVSWQSLDTLPIEDKTECTITN